MKALQRKLSFANITSAMALFIALGGTSYALTLPKNSVGREQLRSNAVGSPEIRKGAVRSSDVRDRSLGVKDLSKRARESLRGATGPAGPPGPAGVTLREAVRATGGRSRGNATGSSFDGTNEYLVTFDRSVDDCVSTATLATVEGVAPPAGRITVAHEAGSVRVRTYNAAGGAQGFPFNLIVAC